MNSLLEQLRKNVSDELGNKYGCNYDSLTRRAYEIFDALINSVMRWKEVHVDCKKGCSYCCELKVDVHPLEVLYLANIVEHMNPTDAARVRNAAKARHEYIQGKNELQLLTDNYPCPLLHDGSCSAYECRPLFCRSFHAQRVATCAYSYVNPNVLDAVDSQNPEVVVAGDTARHIFKAEVAKAGLDTRTYDLGAALHEALTSQADNRFRDGKAAFSRLSQIPE